MNWVGLFLSVFFEAAAESRVAAVQGEEGGREGSSMGQRCFTYGLDTARGQGQVESCSLANVRAVIHSPKICLICQKAGSHENTHLPSSSHPPPATKARPPPQILLSFSRGAFLTYLPLLFKPFP